MSILLWILKRLTCLKVWVHLVGQLCFGNVHAEKNYLLKKIVSGKTIWILNCIFLFILKTLSNNCLIYISCCTYCTEDFRDLVHEKQCNLTCRIIFLGLIKIILWHKFLSGCSYWNVYQSNFREVSYDQQTESPYSVLGTGK